MKLDDVDKKIDQRLNDIKYWKEELEKKLDDIFYEIDNLEAYKVRVENSLALSLSFFQFNKMNQFSKTDPA